MCGKGTSHHPAWVQWHGQYLLQLAWEVPAQLRSVSPVVSPCLTLGVADLILARPQMAQYTMAYLV